MEVPCPPAALTLRRSDLQLATRLPLTHIGSAVGSIRRRVNDPPCATSRVRHESGLQSLGGSLPIMHTLQAPVNPPGSCTLDTAAILATFTSDKVSYTTLGGGSNPTPRPPGARQRIAGATTNEAPFLGAGEASTPADLTLARSARIAWRGWPHPAGPAGTRRSEERAPGLLRRCAW